MNRDEFEIFLQKRITTLRLEKGISERKLGAAIGKSDSYIRSITNGSRSPSLKSLLDIIQFFGMSPEEFFSTEIEHDPLHDFIYDILKNANPEKREYYRMLAEMIKNK